MTLRAVDSQQAIQPIQVIQVRREDAENFELVPFHFQNDGYQPDGENHASGKAVNGVMAQCDGRVTEQESQASNELRAVAQRVRGHGAGDKQHQYGIQHQGMQHLHGRDVK